MTIHDLSQLLDHLMEMGHEDKEIRISTNYGDHGRTMQSLEIESVFFADEKDSAYSRSRKRRAEEDDYMDDCEGDVPDDDREFLFLCEDRDMRSII